MSSSELSDALNPYFTQPRNSRTSNNSNAEQFQPVIQPSQQYVPHRSELEFAISEHHSLPASRPEGQTAIQELLRVVKHTHQAQENERKRRLAWEHEQEERYAKRQAELERQMAEMRQEIYTLRSALPQDYSPTSDMFVQGSSSQSSMYSMQSVSPVSPSVSPIPTLETTYSVDISPSNDSSPESSAHGGNYYQRKCRTVQEAMRRHIFRLMQIETDQLLPNSQEGTHDASQPVRFVWDKTTKQSVHNTHMKTLVLDDIKQNRRLYDELPDKDFSNNILDSVFEQCFTTLRQNFRVQHNSKEAENFKAKEDQRAQNARRLARRKKKLHSRAAARLKILAFEHSAFNGALQIDCVSSEESDDEADPSQPKFVYTRGFPWRSSRLLRFFHVLDQEEPPAPKRGPSKWDRTKGPPKEDVELPPKGVSNWMISRRWVRGMEAKQPDFSEALKNSVVDSSDLPPEVLYQLGEDSEDENEQERLPRRQGEMDIANMAVPQHYSSSSLHNALA